MIPLCRPYGALTIVTRPPRPVSTVGYSVTSLRDSGQFNSENPHKLDYFIMQDARASSLQMSLGFRVSRRCCPFSLRLNDNLDHLAHRAVAAGTRRDEVRRALHFRRGIGYGNSKTHALQ